MVFYEQQFLRKALIGLCVLASVAACSSDARTGSKPDDPLMDLRVMSFNIEWGGAKVSFAKVVEAIQLSGADVVGIQEAEGNLQRLADDLGWHFDLRNYVISRFPLIAPSGSYGHYVFVEVAPGKIVALANVHLPSDAYGPDAVRDGASLGDIIALEETVRLPAIEGYIGPLQHLVGEGVPVFITGDFNAPAHTDWTAATAGTRKFLKFPVEWPVSKALETAGFHDSWREVYPDPVRNPGLTWWAARPPLAEYMLGEDDGQDRIDFIWFGGKVKASNSRLAGELDGPEVSIGLTPWPSDHRAVISDFAVVPANLPEMVSSNKRIYQGDSEISVIYNTTSVADLSIIDLDKQTRVAEHRVSSGRGDWSLPAQPFSPGHYRLQMRNKQNPAGFACDFWVLAKNAVPLVEVLGSSFSEGEKIAVRWRDAPGNRNDYLAAYPPAVITDYENGLAWVYTGALPAGEVRLGELTPTWGWPLAPGRYVIRLIKDDGFEVLAESQPFTVR